MCSSKNSCVLLNQSVITGAPDQQCIVNKDTKKDFPSKNFNVKKKCLAESFKSNKRFFDVMDELVVLKT